MKSALQRLARDLGFDACQVTTAAAPDTAGRFQHWLAEGRQGEMEYLARNAHKRLDPQQVLAGASSIISLASSYAPSHAEQTRRAVETRGAVARYARYADYHDVLSERLKILTVRLQELAGPETRSLWYVDTGPLLERDLAQRAGIGFIGKHTNLISRELGNWFFLSEIITTAEMEPDLPEKNRCGSCSRCLAACPTQAITAPFELDARRCISYLTIELKGSIPVELRPAIGDRIYGCDDCLAVCPWNRFAQEGRMLRAHARPDLDAPALLDLLALDDSQFKARFRGTPLLRTKRRGLLRNVCVALGNVGDATALPALGRAAQDPESLVAEHALWAIEQINRRAKRSGLPDACSSLP
jgi:epoxyqueuosine reductase